MRGIAYQGKSSTLDSDDDRAYRERIAKQQAAAAKAARETKPLPWIDSGGPLTCGAGL
jgi:hypothetical protein